MAAKYNNNHYTAYIGFVQTGCFIIDIYCLLANDGAE